MPVWSAGTQVAPGSGGFELASDALHLESKGRWAGPWECGAHRHTRAGGPQTRQDQADIAPATPGPRQGRTCRGRICVTAVSSELSREAALAGCVCAGGAVRAEPHPPEGRRLVSDPARMLSSQTWRRGRFRCCHSSGDLWKLVPQGSRVGLPPTPWDHRLQSRPRVPAGPEAVAAAAGGSAWMGPGVHEGPQSQWHPPPRRELPGSGSGRQLRRVAS